MLSDCRRSLFFFYQCRWKKSRWKTFKFSNPLEKCKFWKSLTSKRSLRKLFFYQNMDDHFFLINLTQKSLDKEISIFLPKSWTSPFWEYSNFATLYQRFCSREKLVLNQWCRQTAFFKSIFRKKVKDKKFQIFDQNHRLTPLEKCKFCTIPTSIILQSKKLYVY